MNINEQPYCCIHPEAVIGRNVVIHPFVKIEKGVVIGDNCEIRSFVSLLEGTHLGENNKVFEGTVIGAVPQEHLGGSAPYSEVFIGNHNVVRENTVINRGLSPEHATRIGDYNFLMESVHLAHDVEVGNHCVVGCGAKLAPESRLDDQVFLGAQSVVFKYCHIGRFAFVSAGCIVSKHVPPFVRIGTEAPGWKGINTTILQKNGFSEKAIKDILFAYRLVYNEYSLPYVKEKIDSLTATSEVIAEIACFMQTVHNLGIMGKEAIREERE